MPAKKKLVQNEFDVTKWLDSEAKGVDTCGTYAFCSYCDKSVNDPCEAAYSACEKVKKALAAEKRAKTIALKKASTTQTKKTTKKVTK